MNRRQLFTGAAATAIAAAVPKPAPEPWPKGYTIITQRLRPVREIDFPGFGDAAHTDFLSIDRNVFFTSDPVPGLRIRAAAPSEIILSGDLAERCEVKDIDGQAWLVAKDEPDHAPEPANTIGYITPVDRFQTRADIERFYRGQLGEPYRS